MSSINSLSATDIRRNQSEKKVIENFVLIWLDQNINEPFDEYQNSIHLFQSFVNTIKLFSNTDEFHEFIQEIQNEKLFIIISGSLGEKIVPEIEMNTQIHSIYVYCNQKEHHEKWTKDFRKIKGVYTDLRSIRDALRRDIRQANNDLLPIYILPTIKSDQSFACSLLLKEILINSESNERIKNEFIEFSRCCYDDNPIELNLIDHFEKSNYNQISPIEWYTRECFIYSIMQRALRLYDIEILHKTAFFIRDLHRQIQDLHMISTDPQKLTVYYGQGISDDQFKKLNMNTDDLISFNNFLLTTIDRKPSLNFAKQSRNDPNSISIIFQIEIDRSKSSFPFVVLDELDYYHDTNRHILFSLNPIFRIIYIERIEDKLWQINLTLIEDNDNRLKDLTDSIKNKYGNMREFSTLGRMFTKINQLDKAKDVFTVLLNNTITNDDKRLAYIHRYLGSINEKTKDFSNALSHYKDCLHTQLRYLPGNHSSFSSIYAHMGIIQNKQGNLDQALESFHRALKIAVHASKPNASVVSTLMNNIGTIYLSMKDYPQALQYFQKPFKLPQKSHSPEIIADTHNNLSIAFYNLGQYKDAEEHASKAVNIASGIFRENHDMVRKYQDQHNIVIQKQRTLV
jgi:tetratricopeptide (TPR) repeat protein